MLYLSSLYPTTTLEVDTIIIPNLIDDKTEAEGLGDSLQVSSDELLRSQEAVLGLKQEGLAGDPVLSTGHNTNHSLCSLLSNGALSMLQPWLV